jgi:hypothetical protein
MKEDIDCLVQILQIPLDVLDVLLEFLSGPVKLLIPTGVSLQQILPVGIQRLDCSKRILNLTKDFNKEIKLLERR